MDAGGLSDFGDASPRWIPATREPGDLQMALDETLLDACVAAASPQSPVLRLYRWSRPTLSLGYHQRRLEPHWLPLLRDGRLDLVRRPSGGRAVLHGGDLTYALIWPSPGLPRVEAYRQACHWLQAAFAALGQPLVFGAHAPSGQAASCFALATAADLVHTDGSKRIGSAQLWRSGHLLQHGSIQLQPPSDLWQRLFLEPPPDLPLLPVAEEGLETLLRQAAAMQWGSLCSQPLSPAERAAAACRRSRYRLAADSAAAGDSDALDSAAVTSPDPTMPRAT